VHPQCRDKKEEDEGLFKAKAGNEVEEFQAKATNPARGTFDSQSLRLRLESSNKVSACTAYCVEHDMRTSGWLEEEGTGEPCMRVGERGLWGLPYT
jgi:hypothetical protein